MTSEVAFSWLFGRWIFGSAGRADSGGIRRGREPEPLASAAIRATSVEDHALLIQIRTGDVAAFSTAVKTYYGPLCDYASTFTHAPDVAEETVQDVLFRMWIDRDRLDVRGSLRGYLFRLVRNRALDHLRRLKVTERIAVEAAVHGVPPGMATPDGNALDQIIAVEVWEKVRSVIEAMPERRRTVFGLRWDQGLTYEEIADATGGTVEAVRRQLTRALHAIRDVMTDGS